MYNKIFIGLDNNYFFALFVAIVIILIFIFLKNTNINIKKKHSNITMLGYEIIYTDQKEENKKDGVNYGTILYSSKYDIQGKPDYIFRKKFGKMLVPVEIKSGVIGNDRVPHRGDMLQLAAYFLLIEDIYNIRPKFGKLVYKDYMFIIRNTPKIRKQLAKTMSQMRTMLKTGEENCYPSFVLCRYCVCKGTVCEYCQENNKK